MSGKTATSNRGLKTTRQYFIQAELSGVIFGLFIFLYSAYIKDPNPLGRAFYAYMLFSIGWFLYLLLEREVFKRINRRKK